MPTLDAAENSLLEAENQVVITMNRVRCMGQLVNEKNGAIFPVD